MPGHSLDTFPEEIAAVRDAGHEIGLHGKPTTLCPKQKRCIKIGYSHENPSAMSLQQQKEVLDHTYEVSWEWAHLWLA